MASYDCGGFLSPALHGYVRNPTPFPENPHAVVVRRKVSGYIVNSLPGTSITLLAG